MNATNRVANRIVLILVALVLLASSAYAIAMAVPQNSRPAVARDAMNTVDTAAQTAGSWTIQGFGGAELSLTPIVICASAVVLAVALIIFIASRGGGRRREAYASKSAHGSTDVDTRVLSALITERLAERPEIISAHTRVYRVGKDTGIDISVTPRRGAQLDGVIASAEANVAEWDALSGLAQPVVLHISGRNALDRLRSVTRVS